MVAPAAGTQALYVHGSNVVNVICSKQLGLLQCPNSSFIVLRDLHVASALTLEATQGTVALGCLKDGDSRATAAHQPTGRLQRRASRQILTFPYTTTLSQDKAHKTFCPVDKGDPGRA